MYHVAMRLLAISLLVSLPLCVAVAQDKQDKQDKGKGAAQPPNIKVLKIQSRQELGPIMRSYTVGLGVQCTFCHVQGNFPSDDNPKKETARHMIQMVDQLNGGFNAAMGDTKAHITCFTCHRGETEPKTAPEPKPAAQ
jgi:photosynthetic reaction center cytochrome c subunit